MQTPAWPGLAWQRPGHWLPPSHLSCNQEPLHESFLVVFIFLY